MTAHLFGGTEFSELFESMTIRVYADWMFSIYRNVYLMSVLLDVVVAVTFTSFAILYSHSNHGGMVIALITLPCLANLLGSLCSFSLLR